jgi:glutamyl-tRNA(Gln) amidotransferase subunit D
VSAGKVAPSDPWEVLRALPWGQHVELTDDLGTSWSGTVIPSHELSGDRVLTLKLASGYNVGVRIGAATSYRLLEAPRLRAAAPGGPPKASAGGPGSVELLTTGGTIASRVDYETGGVRPVSTEEEILAFYPELGQTGSIRVTPVLDVLSENITPADWLTLAGKVVEAFGRGAQGVVIAHGTDTLGFTAAGLSFLLVDLPGPVVLVGAQRSPDRPSSDGPSNLHAAVRLARDRRLGEVVVVMHEGLSDDRFAVHRGTWVRKMHSSRRDAFESRNGPPLGTIDAAGVHLLPTVRPPAAGPPRVEGPLDARAGLLSFYPGLPASKARQFAEGLRGLVLAGTGLGHVAAEHLPWIREATARGVVIAMTTQCLEGVVDPYVYATGRELLNAGVLFLDDLLPETAYAKLLWALGHGTAPEEVRRLLLLDRAGEFHRRRPLEPSP